jgi:hypothetical protein
LGVIDCTDKEKSDPKLLAYVKGDAIAKHLINRTEFLQECLFYLRNYKTGLIINGYEMNIESANKALTEAIVKHE